MGWDNKQFPEYSQFGTQEECRTLYYKNKCNCTLRYFYVPDDAGTFCQNLSHKSESYKIAVREYDDQLPCSSQVWPCTEIQYNTVIYQSEWPDINSMAFLLKQLVLNFNKTDLAINFYPNELGLGMTEHVRSMPLFNLIQVLNFNESQYINITYVKDYKIIRLY